MGNIKSRMTQLTKSRLKDSEITDELDLSNLCSLETLILHLVIVDS